MISVSVIIPFYNNEKTIGNCIESVQRQSLNDIEIVLVDDGSSDKSLEKARDYTDRDKRIKLFHKENGGVSSARNIGMSKSSGEYIAFVDADDTIESEMYKTLFEKAKMQNADVAISCISINGKNYNDLPWNDNTTLDKQQIIDEFIPNYLGVDKNHRIENEIIPGVVRFLYRKDILIKNNIKFNEKIGYHEDLLFNLLALNKSFQLIIDRNYFYNYTSDVDGRLRRHAFNKRALSHRILIDEIKKLFYIYSAYDNLLNTIGYKITELCESCIYYCVLSNHFSYKNKIALINSIINDTFILECLKNNKNTDLPFRLAIYKKLILSENVRFLFFISYVIYLKKILFHKYRY